MSDFFNRLKKKKWLPVVMTKKNHEKILGDKVTDAIIEERRYQQAQDLGLTVGELTGMMYDNSYVVESQGGKVGVRKRKSTSQLNGQGTSKDIKEVTSEESMFLVGMASGESMSREWSDGMRVLAQHASFNAYQKRCHAKSAVRNLQRYVFGRGIKFDSPSPEVVDCLTKKLWFNESERIKMEQRQKDMFRTKFLDGELFLPMFVDKEGFVKTRIFPSNEIAEIETNPEDVEEIRSYKREWMDADFKSHTLFYKDTNYDILKEKTSFADSHKFEEAVWIYFTKYGELNEKRGRPEMYPMLRYHRLLDDMIGDRAVRQHELSRIFLKKTIKGDRSPEGTTRIQRPPAGGYVLVATDKVDWEIMVPDTRAGDAKEDINLLKYALASGYGVPFFILDQNPENASYASILEAGTPFVFTILDEQDTWKSDFRNIFKFVLRKNVECGQLDKEMEIETYGEERVGEAMRRLLQLYEEEADYEIMLQEVRDTLGKKYKQKIKTIEIPISINFPDVIRTNQFNLAQILKIYGELGLASVQTLSEKAGFNFKEELFRIAMEKKRKMEEAEEALEKYKKNQSMNLPKKEEILIPD